MRLQRGASRTSRRRRGVPAAVLAGPCEPLRRGYRPRMTDEDHGFLTLVGAHAPETEDGTARLVGDVDERHLNPAGTVHGGMLATLVDATMGAAVRSAVDEE